METGVGAISSASPAAGLPATPQLGVTKDPCLYCGHDLTLEMTMITTAEGKKLVPALLCKYNRCRGRHIDPAKICCDICHTIGPVYNLERKKFLCETCEKNTSDAPPQASAKAPGSNTVPIPALAQA